MTRKAQVDVESVEHGVVLHFIEPDEFAETIASYELTTGQAKGLLNELAARVGPELFR